MSDAKLRRLSLALLVVPAVWALSSCSPSHYGGDPSPLTGPDSDSAPTARATATPSATSTPTPTPTVPSDGYYTYGNGRYGFSVQLPASYRRGPEPENGDGARFTSPDGAAHLTVAGANNVLDESAAGALAAYESTIRRGGGRVTYAGRKGNAYVCSGFAADGSIFYQREVVGPTTEYTLAWTYPAPDKVALDPAVSRSVASFTPGPL